MSETRLEQLRALAAQKGQSRVAAEMGVSKATISQVLGGKYAGHIDRVLKRAAETYGWDQVLCPVLGEIDSTRCAAERKTPFSAGSPLRVALHRACLTCERNK